MLKNLFFRVRGDKQSGDCILEVTWVSLSQLELLVMLGILSGEGIVVPEACLGSAHLSRGSVWKQGWGPSKMTLVSVQDWGYLVAMVMMGWELMWGLEGDPWG